MRTLFLFVLFSGCTLASWADELESRAQTHYLPQDFLETVVRTEGWTEVTLKPYEGVRKGDIARIWAGGMVDRGDSDQPGLNCYGPTGLDSASVLVDPKSLALSPNPKQAFALLFKTEDGVAHACNVAGKPLEIKLGKENAKLWIGYNDLKGRFRDNHLGKGRRHELDPLWVRIEVIRVIVD